MEEQGRETETQKILQNQRQQAKLELRKKNINQILMEKRMFQAHQKELSQPIEIEVPEVKEEIEVERRLGHLSLSKHCNNKKKRQKKCWNCKSTKHFKERCPYLRCFFCHKKGHIKKVCFFKKLMEQIKWMENLKKKKEHKKKLKKKKDKPRREQVHIYKTRLQQSEFIKQEGKWKLKCEDQIIGQYIGIAEPINLKELRHDSIKWKHVDRIILRETPIERTPLLDGFVSLCGCGNVDILERNSFVSHINRGHYGIVPPSTCLNQPPWIQLVHFVSDEIEDLYCRSDASLT